MDEFTSVAFWLMIALMSTNVVFTWLTFNNGLMALKVAPDSVFASENCTYFIDKANVNSLNNNTITEDTPSTSKQAQGDFTKSYSCTADTLWTMTGGWAIALGTAFSGGIFGDPTSCNATTGCSLGYLFLNFVLPVFIIAQVIAFLLILYRVLIAGKGLFGFGGV